MDADTILLERMYDAAAMTYEQDGVQNKAVVKEMMDTLRHMIARDDKGWVQVFGGNSASDNALAIRLDDLRRWEKEISELTLGASWIKRGLTLRHGYIWNGAIRYGELPAGGSQGVPDVQKRHDDPDNQEHFFGADARRRREARLYYSGIALYVGDDKTKKLTPLPLGQVTDQILAPDGTGAVWAYKREWTTRDLKTGEPTQHKEWIFTDRAIGHRVDYIEEAGQGATKERVPVSQTKRIFDLHANRLEGMAYGVPDALAAAAWHKIAKNAYLDGITMTQALATFAYQVTSKKEKGGQSAAIALATPQTAGSTAVVGTNELRSLNTAGNSYDFAGLTPVLAIVATSLDVSVIHLSASPGDAGSSYSAAETMDMPTRLAMSARRDMHVEFDARVLRWMGVKKPEVFFAPFESGAETYRNLQALILAAQAGAYSIQELRDMIDDLLARPNGTIPKGALEYNNIETKKLEAEIAKASKPEPAPAGGQGADGNKSVASPAQGRQNGTGGQDGGNATNDLRDA